MDPSACSQASAACCFSISRSRENIRTKIRSFPDAEEPLFLCGNLPLPSCTNWIYFVVVVGGAGDEKTRPSSSKGRERIQRISAAKLTNERYQSKRRPSSGCHVGPSMNRRAAQTTNPSPGQPGHPSIQATSE